jgi:hypothetical protein
MADSQSNIELAAGACPRMFPYNYVRVSELSGLFGTINSALVRISSEAI